MALVAMLLVADAPAREHEESTTSVRSEQVVSASEVSRIVGSVSPTLSQRELERIGAAVVRFSGKYGLDPELVTAVLLVESSARPWVRSPKGAIGLMQVMPYMAAPMGMAGNLATIESNVEAGCIILAGNIARLGEEDGISAYFWGSKIRGVAYLGRVQAARDRVRRELHS
jgi:soluble lytic murein transglycosylase-like protein